MHVWRTPVHAYTGGRSRALSGLWNQIGLRPPLFSPAQAPCPTTDSGLQTTGSATLDCTFLIMPRSRAPAPYRCSRLFETFPLHECCLSSYADNRTQIPSAEAHSFPATLDDRSVF